MPVKIRGAIRLDRRLRKFLPDARSRFAKDMKRTIVDIIVEKIVGGISPVKGQNRYKKYSNEYAKYKGRKQPVDLVDTGNMLNSLRAKITNKKSIVLEFQGRENRKIASYHHFGKGKMPERRILPSKGQEFKASIMNKIVSTVRKAVRLAIR